MCKMYFSNILLVIFLQSLQDNVKGSAFSSWAFFISHSQTSVLIKGETTLYDTGEFYFIEFHGIYSRYFNFLKMGVWLSTIFQG